MKDRLNIWMIPKWYPNRDDPQFGVFIRKHASAISLYDDIVVLNVQSVASLKNKFEVEEKFSKGMSEVSVYFRKNNSFLNKVINFFRYRSAMKKGLMILENKFQNPDIIHAYILARTGYVAQKISRSKNIPFIISEQWSGYATGKYNDGSFIRKMIVRRLIKNSAAVTSVSNFLIRKMKECGLSNNNFKLIPNVVENIPALQVREKKDYVSVLLVADLVDEIKNISGVIRMIGNLKTEIKFRLHIIGRGADGEKLKRLTSELELLDRKIFFEGLKSNEEVYDYLSRCDFLLMNSNFETFSLICAEAMSCGKPVLATRCGGPDEFVIPETGILIEPGNNAELETNFLNMLNHFQDFSPEKISAYSKSLFSAELIGKMFHDLYQSVDSNLSS